MKLGDVALLVQMFAASARGFIVTFAECSQRSLHECSSCHRFSGVARGYGNFLLRREKSSHSRHMNLINDFQSNDGDSFLSNSVTSIISGNIENAVECFTKAREAYRKDGMLVERQQLLSEVDQRIQAEKMRRDNASKTFEKRTTLLKVEGDQKISDAVGALARREFATARMLLDQAKNLFGEAGPSIQRDREALVGNLFSSIVIEEEREVMLAKAKAKRERELQDQQNLIRSLDRSEERGGINDESTRSIYDLCCESMRGDVCFLVDNGSSSPHATESLRTLASALSKRLGIQVVPCSMQHADKAPLKPQALLFRPLIERLAAIPSQRRGERIIIAPLFLGANNAVTQLIPAALEAAKVSGAIGGRKVFLAEALAVEVRGVERLSDMLAQEVRRILDEEGLQSAALVVVDHGSPSPIVTQVREDVARRVEEVLRAERRVSSVTSGCMEAPAAGGVAGSYGLPLRDALLQAWERDKAVIVGLLFLLPGTHAGPGGDIEAICRSALASSSPPGEETRRVFRTKLLWEQAPLVELLALRCHEALLGPLDPSL